MNKRAEIKLFDQRALKYFILDRSKIKNYFFGCEQTNEIELWTIVSLDDQRSIVSKNACPSDKNIVF